MSNIDVFTTAEELMEKNNLKVINLNDVWHLIEKDTNKTFKDISEMYKYIIIKYLTK